MTERGRLVWYELLSTDPEAAIEFYTKVTGWTTERFERGDYTMFVSPQGPLGGVSALPEAAKQLGAGSYWQANIEVDNVDETLLEVTRRGGRVYVSEEVPTVGRIAVIADPQGAVIAVFTPAREMKSHDTTRHGEWSWAELFTSDHQAAFEFYRAIAGWDKVDEMDMGPMGTYVMFGRGEQALGGMMTKPPGMKTPDGRDVPNAWLFYITVADFDAALARAKAAGATVLQGPMPVPGGQQIVQLMDPQGGAFALVTVA